MKPMGVFRPDSDWKWDGTLWDFVEIVQWAMVVRDVGKHNGNLDIISDPKRALDYAYDHGITRRAVVREMQRIAKDGANMLWAIDEASSSAGGAENNQSATGEETKMSADREGRTEIGARE